jgi:virginiamycin B lyase
MNIMTIILSNIFVITIAILVFLLVFSGFFITHNNLGSDLVYGHGFEQPRYFEYYGSDPEQQKNPAIHSIDIPLNITILDQEDNRDGNNKSNSNSINTSKSSNLVSNSSTANITRQDEFGKGFCGMNSTTTAYSEYVLEYPLPQSCEMPLGIAVDSEDKQVWYISTKRGILGMYDITENKFKQYTIPQWYVREDPNGFSQVWDMKVDDENNDDELDDIWFTDTAQNAIWRFRESTEQFEIYRIPAQSESFGTTYPITINIVTNESEDEDSGNEKEDNDNDLKSIYFIGTFVPSLWYSEIDDLKNGTSDGIREVKLPIEYGFKNIDPFYVTSGSFEFDEERNSAWISMLSYSRKGQILEYDFDSKSFNIFGLPDDLSSPLGIVVGDNNLDTNSDRDDTFIELWITNPGTSTFYNYKISEPEKRKNDYDNTPTNAREASGDNMSYNIDIERYTTSMASPRIFGKPFHNFDTENNNDNKTHIDDLRNKYYTLPSWIKKSSDGAIWFNQQQGNKISRFDPSEQELVEYWIPSQNNEWGNCEEDGKSNGQGAIEQYTARIENCGIANVLNFALMESDEKGGSEDDDNMVEEVWFTEWSTNKIGRIDVSKDPPFDIKILESERELTVKRGESEEIKLTVEVDPKKFNDNQNNGNNDKNDNDEQTSVKGLSGHNDLIAMTAAGTFTSTGYLGNSTGHFDVPLISYDGTSDDNKDSDSDNEQEVSFVFTPSKNMIPGDYTLMLGAEDKSISILKAVKIHII